VVADPFDHRLRAAVAHREPLAGPAAEERLAAGRAVQATLPMTTLSSGTYPASGCGDTISFPPDRPLPT
jgi:hypothetical protein